MVFITIDTHYVDMPLQNSWTPHKEAGGKYQQEGTIYIFKIYMKDWTILWYKGCLKINAGFEFVASYAVIVYVEVLAISKKILQLTV